MYHVRTPLSLPASTPDLGPREGPGTRRQRARRRRRTTLPQWSWPPEGPETRGMTSYFKQAQPPPQWSWPPEGPETHHTARTGSLRVVAAMELAPGGARDPLVAAWGTKGSHLPPWSWPPEGPETLPAYRRS